MKIEQGARIKVSRGHYSVVPNETARDARLSWRARGILVWLLSQADGWEASIDAIVEAGTEGEYAVRQGVKELEAAGYVVRTDARGKAGRWVNVLLVVHDRPHAEIADGSGATDRIATDRIARIAHPKKELPLEALDLEEPPCAIAPPSRPSEPKPPTTGDRARVLLKAEWDARDPKPAGSFMGAAKMVERCLDGGWPERLVAEALRRTVVFTGNGMDAARAQIERERGGGQRRAGPASTERPWMRR